MRAVYTILALSAALQLGSQSSPTTAICKTPQCLQSAADILKDMRTTEDPCVDFSRFACGGFYEREKLQKNEKKNGYLAFIEKQNKELIRSILTNTEPKDVITLKGDTSAQSNLKKLQSFYSACMDENRLSRVGRQPLQEQIRKMMEIYPVSKDVSSSSSNRQALSKLLGHNMRNGFENPFAFELWDDETNPGYRIMTLQHTGLGLKDDSIYSDEQVITLYEGVIAEMFYIILGGGQPSSGSSQLKKVPEVWKRVAKDIIEFERVIAGVSVKPESSNTASVASGSTSPNDSTFNTSRPSNQDDNADGEAEAEKENEEEEEEEEEIVWDTIDDLEKMTPSLDWRLILKTAFPQDAPIPSKLNMLWKFYLSRIETALQNTPAKTIQNYFAWNLMRTLGINLAEPYQLPLKVLEKALPGGSEVAVAPRWESCVEMVNENLGEMVGNFFVQSIFPEASQVKVNEMIGSIRWSFEKSFWQFDWMDPQTRQNALQKLKAVTQKVGYSTKNPNVTSSASIEAYYHGLDIRGDDHFGNRIRGSAWRMEGFWRSASQPIDRIKLESIPQTVNAFYKPTVNAIEIPAGILQPPFFHIDSPEYLNYGGIGGVAAHELVHAFDNSGSRYDETGRVRDWWTNESLRAFDKRSKCFIDQYSEFTIQGPDGTNHYVNGWGTLGENIADNGGIKIAYEAWRQRYNSDHTSKSYNNNRLPKLEVYTPEQLFFIQFARAFCSNITPDEQYRLYKEDNHSPGKWRINGVVQNSVNFAKAFQCKAGTPMNPVKKCVLW